MVKCHVLEFYWRANGEIPRTEIELANAWQQFFPRQLPPRYTPFFFKIFRNKKSVRLSRVLQRTLFLLFLSDNFLIFQTVSFTVSTSTVRLLFAGFTVRLSPSKLTFTFPLSSIFPPRIRFASLSSISF